MEVKTQLVEFWKVEIRDSTSFAASTTWWGKVIMVVDFLSFHIVFK